jgi:hypothetical protein
MPYILNKTNGSIVAVVQDAALDKTTDLTFLGRNYAGYGEVQNENFLKLLENFSNTTPPTKPIEGQVWFDSRNKKINFYDNSNWKSIANLEVSKTNPAANKTFVIGDFWYNNDDLQLYAYTGSEFSLIGPPSGDDLKAGWRGSREYSVTDGLDSPKYNLKAVLTEADEVIALVSAESYTVSDPSGAEKEPTFPIFAFQSVVKKGITLIGSNPDTGVSENNGIYFWGSAAHSLLSNTATYAISSSGVTFTNNTNTNFAYNLSFFNGANSNSTSSLYIDRTGLTYNPAIKTLKTSYFDGIATAAYYADLAERYESDQIYDYGTVVAIGGNKEITVTSVRADTAIAGVISKNPAYMMNASAGNNETHPYIALKGRVQCKVLGPIKKGSLLVSSNKPGYAEEIKLNDHPSAVIGKALEDFNGELGMIEILV